MLPKIEEGFKHAMICDLYGWVMNNSNKTDIAWHESKASLAEYLVNKGWVKGE